MAGKSDAPKNQYDDSEKDSSLVLPGGGSKMTLHKVNPSSDVTPQTRGQTTSTNQLKPGTSGFEQK